VTEAARGSIARNLAASQARFHGWAEDVEVDWALNPEALEFLETSIKLGHRTLETGAGYSTVVFAACGAVHTVVSPFAWEHDRIRAWCEAQGIDLSHVEFVAAPSQDVLPTLEASPLDLVLIDGDHAFPIPYVDFWYTATRLVPGGLLVVDDTHLRACHVLDEFLASESPRWRLHTKLRTTSIFERLDAPVLPEIGWEGQPWGEKPLLVVHPDPLMTRIRGKVRARTRLKRALHRFTGDARNDGA
jgi:predicted O-methyltransferase YrrM